MKDKILEGAHGLFVQYGVRSVSMDDVARELSVSKKTLYQYFTNKESLVTEAVKLHMEQERELFLSMEGKASNSIEEIFLMANCMREHVFKLNPSLLYDLRKYHADAWAIFEDFKKEFLNGQITRNLEKGVEEGYYREEINPRVLAILRIQNVEMVFDEQIFPQSEFDFVAVQMQVFDHFIQGILTDKGRELYKKYFQGDLKIIEPKP